MALSILVFVQILLGVFIKRPLATRRAEVISLPVIFRCASRGLRRHIHATYGVYESFCHFESPCTKFGLLTHFTQFCHRATENAEKIPFLFSATPRLSGWTT